MRAPGSADAPRSERRAVGLAAGLVALLAAGCQQGQPPPGAADPIRPNGHTRSRAEIVRFMEQEVMPFALTALEPVVGRGNVTCRTCHGPRPEERNWQMPAVAALPDEAVRGLAGSVGADSQVRNALHGYASDPGKQAVTAHMRTTVLPGMARLLQRPAYDYTQTYAYNAERRAFGCYHCHTAG
ncbi:MAG: hypothetical protein AB7H96_04990 [Vicinamibacterales bacterium]